MSRTAAAFATLLLGSAPLPVALQDKADPASHPTTASSSDLTEVTEVDQVGAPDRSVIGSPPVLFRRPSNDQVTAERGAAYSNLDLTGTAPSAAALPSPSGPADGRDTSAVVPTGPDQCDPRRRPLPVACDRVIEARAGEFQTPDHGPLSAEQLLLVSQGAPRPTSGDLNQATRRLASGEADGSEAGLAVASVALQDTGPPKREEPPVEDLSALDAIVVGLTTFVVGLQPNP